ncbi:hypothetical protein [Pararhizobium gei]|uniref:hypothetical protein n=1 Tax=Pararhizobium gei TaxID=1395951 RepID=UPI0023DC8161|nr:hypothetical protein [Rhizobium gei]
MEKLGRALDNCEVAYSPTLSASISGTVHLGFVDYMIPDNRERLTRGELRLVFDTSLAHRRSTYFDVGDPWAHDTDKVVANLMSALSSPGNVRWHAVGTPTALSIHGATRRRFTPAQRRAELEDWTIRLASSTPESLVEAARVEWYVMRCLTKFRDRSFAGIDDFLPAIGIPAHADDPEQAIDFTDDQCHAASITIDLHNKKAVRSERLIEMLPYLLDPILGSTLHISQIETDLVESLGLPETLDLVGSVRATHPYYNELQKLMKSSLLRKSGRHDETRQSLDIRHDAPVYFQAEIYTADGVAAEALKQTNDAIDSALKALSGDGSYLPAHLLLIRCLARNKDFPAAKSAAEAVFALSPKSDIVDYVKRILG